MGKKRIITSGESRTSVADKSGGVEAPKKSGKKQVLRGVVSIFSTYNNTIVSVSDLRGEVFAFSSAGLMGFKGARKSTPYAATLVGKDALEKAKRFGLQDVKVQVKGVGPGREAAIRGVISSGINVASIIDATPIAHNGVRPTKPRRV